MPMSVGVSLLILLAIAPAGSFAGCDAAAVPPSEQELQQCRLQSGVLGFPMPGPPVLLKYVAGASPGQLAAQYQLLREIEGASVWYDGYGVPRHLYGKTGVPVPLILDTAAGREALDRIMAHFRPLLLSEGTETLTFQQAQDGIGGRSLAYVESINGIPVHGAQIGMFVDARTQQIVEFNAVFLPDRNLPRHARISAAEAIERAFKWLGEFEAELRGRDEERQAKGVTPPFEAESPQPIEEVERPDGALLRYHIGQPNDVPPPRARLVWIVELSLKNGFPFKTVLIDAEDGSYVGSFNRWSH